MGIPALLQLKSFKPELLASMTERLASGCFFSNLASEQIEWSAKTLRVLGYDPETQDFSRIDDLFHPDDRRWLHESHKEPHAAQHDWNRRVRLRRADGRYAMFDLTGHWLYDGGERPSYVVGFVHDVSEIETLRDRLGRVGDLFSSFFDNAPFAAYIKDAQSRHIYANKFTAELTGHPIDKLLYLGMDEIFDPETARRLSRTDRQVLMHGETIVKEEWITPLGGEPRLIVDTKFPIILPETNRAALGGFGIDITEQSRTKAQLAQAQKMEALGQLVAGIAHDFNNTLAIMQGNLDFLQRDACDADRNAAIDDMMRGVDRAATLTEQLLTFGRKAVVEPKPIDVARHIETVSLNMMRSALPESIELDFSAQRNVPRVLLDERGLDNVLLNLALNARDAMPEGGRLRIDVSSGTCALDECLNFAPDQDLVRILVADDGPGMDEATAQRVFEPFFTTKAAAKGSGMGLAMVHGFVKQAGGDVNVMTAPGKGARFDLLLPASDAGPSVPSRKDRPGSELQTGSERILLIEDQEAVRATLKRQLTMLGYSVACVADGTAALEALEAETGSYNVMLTDYVLPGEWQGGDLVRLVRERFPEIACLIMSGYPIGSDQARLGDVQQLQKPVSLQRLSQAVRQAIADNV